MKTLIHSLIFVSLIILSCNKKDNSPETVNPPVTNPPDTNSICKNLPPTPKPFGWQDTLTDEEKNVNTFFYNPLNADELVYVVNGTIFGGFNKLYKYNIPSQSSVLLGYNINFTPRVNQFGWITYSDVNSDVWRVKINGDSSIQFTNNQLSDNPQWDYSGKYIYFFQKPKGIYTSQIVKANLDGSYAKVFPADLPYIACFHKSDKLLYLEIKNNTHVNLILKDIENPSETVLLSDVREITPGENTFNNLCVDNEDENFFWSNSIGIFSCNLTSLKIDTLFKNCPTVSYNNPIISSKPNELYYTQHLKSALSVYKLFHKYKAIEHNLISKQGSEVKIFP